MAERVQATELGAAIESALTIYGQAVNDEIERVTKESMDEIVAKTRATAPIGHRGKFKKQIASKKLPHPRGSKYVWYVKAPDYRLTHLVVHGHAKRGGGRTRGNPFLANALNAVLPSYENKIKEAVRSGGR